MTGKGWYNIRARNLFKRRVSLVEKEKKEKKKWSLRKKVIVGILIFLAVLLLLAGGALIFIMTKLDKMNLVDREYDNSVYESIYEEPPEVENPNSEPDSPKEEIDSLEDEINKNLEELKQQATELKFPDEVLNVLLIGTDARTSDYRGRSDSMILVSINKKTEEIVMTSIMRDIYLSIPGKYNNRINAAYAFGGADLLIQTIEQNFGIRIDKFVQVDFTSFVKVVDAVGGVEIEVKDNEISTLNSYLKEINALNGFDIEDGKLEKGGKYKLNGRQALAYSRIRYVGNADFERTQRQRRVLEEIFKSAKGLSVFELSDSLDVILPLITTDFTKGELLDLILDSVSYLSYDRTELRIPADGYFWNMRINGMAVLGIDFEQNRQIMIDKIYGKE